MKSKVSLQVDTDTLLRLISQLKLRGGTQDLSEAITSASNSRRATASPRPRDTTPGEGWTLPERRKFRYRLEDIAF
jgi:hypothetical protein